MKLPGTLMLVMNSTKWDELRLAICELELTPGWRTKCWETGYISEWDREWYHHFQVGGYELIEWMEIRIESKEQRENVLSELARVHAPTQELSNSFRVYGYIQSGQSIEYAKL